ncbi:bifunctional 4-hydroxy-2-oxoglutarate aldolase/2-dehydro-3-deoxy-phosphogluconate aldolase [bacterium 210820-DFI.6.37]|nr:bifunctional 4-hydroxy-2-oxoglutarate aldolase/2-dehydro-3-deoxy-phosphogluconate aldolase [bacterium 210820-DFI.6.37]
MRITYDEICDAFYEIGIIPVIKLSQIEKARQLAEALVSGNVPAAEVTFRAEGAERVIETMRSFCGDMLVGAGTVLSEEQARQAESAGARFIVSPGFNPSVVEYCLKKNIPVFPGCVTPTEIERAMEYGLKVLKFFPAEAYGGVKTIKALSAPYPQIRFMPTGGISLENLKGYLSNKSVAACGGSFMVKAELLEESQWDQVRDLCGKAADIVKEARR